MSDARVEEQPGMWFSLPPGFVPLGDRMPEGVTESLTEGLSPESTAVIADAVASAETMLEAQRTSPLRFHAAGMHPREDGGTDLSQLSAGTVSVERGTPDALLLRVARSEEEREETTTVQVVEFPAGRAVLAQRSVTVAEVEMRGIRATFAHPDLHHLAVIDLASNAIPAWDSYVEVMLGMLAPSLSFEDPAEVAAREAAREENTERLDSRLGGGPGQQEENSDG